MPNTASRTAERATTLDCHLSNVNYFNSAVTDRYLRVVNAAANRPTLAVYTAAIRTLAALAPNFSATVR